MTTPLLVRVVCHLRIGVLGLAMVLLCTKSEVSICTRSKDREADAKCRQELIRR